MLSVFEEQNFDPLEEQSKKLTKIQRYGMRFLEASLIFNNYDVLTGLDEMNNHQKSTIFKFLDFLIIKDKEGKGFKLRKWLIVIWLIFSYLYAKYLILLLLYLINNYTVEDLKADLRPNKIIANPMIHVPGLFFFVLATDILLASYNIIASLVFTSRLEVFNPTNIKFILRPNEEIRRIDNNISDIIKKLSNSLKFYQMKLIHISNAKIIEDSQIKLSGFKRLCRSVELSNSQLTYYSKHLQLLRPANHTIKWHKTIRDDLMFRLALQNVILYSLTVFLSILVLIVISREKCKPNLLQNRCTISDSFSAYELLNYIEVFVFGCLVYNTLALNVALVGTQILDELELIKDMSKELNIVLNELRLLNHNRDLVENKKLDLQQEEEILIDKETREKLADELMLKTMVKILISQNELRMATRCLQRYISFFLADLILLVSVITISNQFNKDENETVSAIARLVLFIIWVFTVTLAFSSASISAKIFNLTNLFWMIWTEQIYRLRFHFENDEGHSLDFVTTIWMKFVFNSNNNRKQYIARPFNISLNYAKILEAHFLVVSLYSLLHL